MDVLRLLHRTSLARTIYWAMLSCDDLPWEALQIAVAEIKSLEERDSGAGHSVAQPLPHQEISLRREVHR